MPSVYWNPSVHPQGFQRFITKAAVTATAQQRRQVSNGLEPCVVWRCWVEGVKGREGSGSRGENTEILIFERKI